MELQGILLRLEECSYTDMFIYQPIYLTGMCLNFISHEIFVTYTCISIFVTYTIFKIFCGSKNGSLASNNHV